MNFQFSLTSQRTKWAGQLQATTAKHQLEHGRPDLVPLTQVEAATDAVLSHKKIPPRSERCDTYLLAYLAEFRGQLYAEHVAIISCAHALTYDTAREAILSVKPDPNTAKSDPYFHYRTSAYLQTVMLARQADASLVPERVFFATDALFRTMQSAGDHVPSITYLLRALGHDFCEELLPTGLVKKVLEIVNYWERLEVELDRLAVAREWAEAWKLAKGFSELRSPRGSLENLIPNTRGLQRWLAWDPNVGRIKLWDTRLQSQHHKQHLDLLLALEGPDISTQGLPTTRRSPHATQLLGIPFEVSEHLDQVLELLDDAISIGRQAVNLFIFLIVQQGPPNRQRIDRVRACLAAGHDSESKNSAARRVLAFHRAIETTGTAHGRLKALTSALHLFTASPHLLAVLSVSPPDLASRVVNTLSSVQGEFCALLTHKSSRAISQLALCICAFVREVGDAHWLSAYWSDGYLALVRQIPSEAELQAMLRGFEKAEGDAKRWYRDDIAARVGFSPCPGHITSTPTPKASSPKSPASPVSLSPLSPLSPSSPPSFVDPIWHASLDIYRALLRTQVFAPLQKTAPDLATACLRQSRQEHDTFVQELLALLPQNANSDIICVNLCSFLGPRAASGRMVHEVWKALLLHMVRSLPRGLLDRCAATMLSRDQFKSWVLHLRRLYAGTFLDPEGGLGITEEGIRDWMVRTKGMGRSISARTQKTFTTVVTSGSGVSAACSGGDGV